MSRTGSFWETHLSVALMISLRVVSFRHLHGGRLLPFGGGAGQTADGRGPRCTRGVLTAADVRLVLGCFPSDTQDEWSLSC